MAQDQYSVNVPVADTVVRIITEVATRLHPSQRREFLCALQEDITHCIANIDERARLDSITARMHANRVAWGGWSAVEGYQTTEKEGSD